MESVLTNIEKHLPDTSMSISRPNGSSCVVQVMFQFIDDQWRLHKTTKEIMYCVMSYIHYIGQFYMIILSIYKKM